MKIKEKLLELEREEKVLEKQRRNLRTLYFVGSKENELDKRIFELWNYVYPLIDNPRTTPLIDSVYKILIKDVYLTPATARIHISLYKSIDTEEDRFYISLENADKKNTGNFRKTATVIPDEYIIETYNYAKKIREAYLNEWNCENHNSERKKIDIEEREKFINEEKERIAKEKVKLIKKNEEKEKRKEEKKALKKEKLVEERKNEKELKEESKNEIINLCNELKIKVKFVPGSILLSTPFGNWMINENEIIEKDKIKLYHKNTHRNINDWHKQKFESYDVKELIQSIHNHDYKKNKIYTEKLEITNEVIDVEQKYKNLNKGEIYDKKIRKR